VNRVVHLVWSRLEGGPSAIGEKRKHETEVDNPVAHCAHPPGACANSDEMSFGRLARRMADIRKISDEIKWMNYRKHVI